MTHHLCIHEDCTTFDDISFPFGKDAIEKETTKVINEIVDGIIHKIGSEEVVLCGEGDAIRMLGRKLEDRLGREIRYK